MSTLPSKRDSNWTLRELETAYDTLRDIYEEQKRRTEAVSHHQEKILGQLDSVSAANSLQHESQMKNFHRHEQTMQNLQQQVDKLRGTGVVSSAGSDHEQDDDAEGEDEEDGSRDDESQMPPLTCAAPSSQPKDDQNASQAETTTANDNVEWIAVLDYSRRFKPSTVLADSPSPSQPSSSQSENPNAK